VKMGLRPKTRGNVERVKKETARHIRKGIEERKIAKGGEKEGKRERGSLLDGRARAVSSGDHGLFYGGRGGAFGCADELHVHQP